MGNPEEPSPMEQKSMNKRNTDVDKPISDGLEDRNLKSRIELRLKHHPKLKAQMGILVMVSLTARKMCIQFM